MRFKATYIAIFAKYMKYLVKYGTSSSPYNNRHVVMYWKRGSGDGRSHIE